MRTPPRRRSHRSLLFAGALLAAAPAQASAAVPELPGLDFSQQERARLGRGEALIRSEVERDASGRGGGTVVAFFVADIGWRQAFDALARHEEEPRYSDCMKEALVLVRVGGEVERIKVRETHGFLFMRQTYTLDYEHDALRREIRWSLDPSAENDMRRFDGAWVFSALDDRRTLVTYRVRGETSGWVPGFIRDYFVKSGIPSMMEQFRRRVSGSTSGS